MIKCDEVVVTWVDGAGYVWTDQIPASSIRLFESILLKGDGKILLIEQVIEEEEK